MVAYSKRRVGFLLQVAFLIAVALPSDRVWADNTAKPDASPKCMMWTVSSPTSTVYLVGSMHLATPEMYPLPKEMEEAFAKSDTLVVEVDITKIDQKKLRGMVAAKGMYQGNDSLSTSIKKETYDRTTTLCQEFGLPPAGIEKMKPWLLGVTLEEFEIQKAGLDPKLGIDMHFLSLANRKKMTVEELESLDFQLGVLAGFDDKVQEKFLAQTIDEAGTMKDDVKKMTDAWMAGDGKAILDLMIEKQSDTPEMLQKIIYDRNGPMEEKVKGYLKGNKTVFVIAGCAHMVGDKGIVELLKKDDYKVEQSAATKSAAKTEQ